MTEYDFDKIIPRRSSNSAKWANYESDVLPLWVADMDFQSPPAVLEALHKRIDHGIFGYTRASDNLAEIICQRMENRYDWKVTPDEVIFLPGLVYGLNIVAKTFGKRGDGVIMTTPVYGWFINVPSGHGQVAQQVALPYVQVDEHTFRYDIDFDAFENAITPETSIFFLCNPHNPTGHIFTQEELEKFAEICLKHNILICADEIHSDLLLEDHPHIPIASLSPEISQQTVTLVAPSKTFNLAGLGFSVIIAQNPEMKERIEHTLHTLNSGVNLFGYEAGCAAYRHGDEWLSQLLVYLRENRDFVLNALQNDIPSIKAIRTEATYLMWLDCQSLPIQESAYEFFLREAKIGLSPGDFFGADNHFVRLNFGTQRENLSEALGRMKTAVDAL